MLEKEQGKVRKKINLTDRLEYANHRLNAYKNITKNQKYYVSISVNIF